MTQPSAAIVNKAEIARTVYDEQEALAKAGKRDMIRKDVVALLMQQAGLSKAGAQTYYQTIKKKKMTLQATKA